MTSPSARTLPTLSSEQLKQLKSRPYAAILITEQGMPFDEAMALPPAELARRVLVLPEWPARPLLPNQWSCCETGAELADAQELVKLLIEHVRMHAAELMGADGYMLSLGSSIDRYSMLMLCCSTPGGRVAANTADTLFARRDLAVQRLKQNGTPF